jgi:hypothetical protein
MLFRETPINLPRLQQGDLKNVQQVDNEPSAGDLRPSFVALGTDANKQRPAEAEKERISFARFNWVPKGFGAAKNDVLAVQDREWDANVRFTEPIDTQLADPITAQARVSQIRPTAGIYASPAVTNPAEISRLRALLQTKYSRASLTANTLLRDDLDNDATFKPTPEGNLFDTNTPLANMVPTNTNFAGYWRTNQVTNPPEGMTTPIVRDTSLGVGPEKRVPAGRSFPLPPYQLGTNPTNYFPSYGWIQYSNSLAPGSAVSAYAPTRQNLLNGLDYSAASEYLSPLPARFGSRPPLDSFKQGASLRFPSQVAGGGLYPENR